MFLKKGVHKNFAIFTGKHLRKSPFLTKLQVLRPATSLKRDSNAGAFLGILQNFQEQLFIEPSGSCFCLVSFLLHLKKHLPNAILFQPKSMLLYSYLALTSKTVFHYSRLFVDKELETTQI